MEKMTNRKALEFILEHFDLPTEVEEKCKGMVEQLIKKAATPRKQTATQKENEGYLTLITEFLADGEARSVAQMIKGIPAFAEFSTPKVSALVKKLKDDGIVVREEIKGRAFFRLS